jgi:ribokinase
MRPSAEILVVGDALLDVYVAPSEPMRSGGDVPAVIRIGPGGQGANVAVRLARRGVRVRLACALGDDASGRIVREALEADRVALEIAPAEATGAVVILVDQDGERTMLSRRVPLLPRTLEAAPWTVVSGYALLEDDRLELHDAHRRAVLGCSLPVGAEEAWWRRADDFRPDIVFLNADEARAIGADARTLAAEAGTLVVVTGPEGATVTEMDPDTEPRHVSARRVPGVDSTGAGDAFAAAFLAEVHDWPTWAGVDMDRALAAGMELAAAVAAVPGAQARVAGELPA